MQEQQAPASEAHAIKPQTDSLWRIDDIADYFRVSRSTAFTLAAGPSFPRSIKPLPKVRRWVPVEVKKWAERQRG